MQEKGRELLEKSRRVLERDVRSASKDNDFEMVVRRSQEAVGLALKGALKLLGVDYPRIHDVAPVLVAQLRKKRSLECDEVLDEIERISLWLSQARAPAFYGEREYGSEDASLAQRDAQFVVDQVKDLFPGST